MTKSTDGRTVKKYEQIFGVSRSTAKRDLKELLDLNIISKDKIQGKKETLYVIA